MARICGRVIGFALLVCTLAAFVGVGAAGADPNGAKNALFVALDCGGPVVQTVTNGGGNLVPTHDRNGTGVFIATKFGEQHGVFTDPDGNEFPFEDTAVLEKGKGSASPNGQPIVDCDFIVDQDTPDGGHLFVDGTVSGFWTH